jgi:hypothetical protein
MCYDSHFALIYITGVLLSLSPKQKADSRKNLLLSILIVLKWLLKACEKKKKCPTEAEHLILKFT